MSDKKLLTESEMRRFMRLANIEPLFNGVVKENYMEDTGEEDGAKEDGMSDVMPPEDSSMENAEGGEQEALDLLKKAKEAATDEEASDYVKQAFEKLGMGDKFDVSSEDAAPGMEDEMPAEEEPTEKDEENEYQELEEVYGEDGSEEEGEEEEEEEEGEEEEEEEEGESEEEEEGESEDEEEEDEEGEMQESSLTEDELVEAIVQRVSNRLIAEAKKKNEVKQKVKSKMKQASSNGAKNGLKGHGPGNKKFGTSGIKDAEWRDGVRNKTSTLKPLPPNGKDIKTHGKSSKVTSKGKNTKKV